MTSFVVVAAAVVASVLVVGGDVVVFTMMLDMQSRYGGGVEILHLKEDGA